MRAGREGQEQGAARGGQERSSPLLPRGRAPTRSPTRSPHGPRRAGTCMAGQAGLTSWPCSALAEPARGGEMLGIVGRWLHPQRWRSCRLGRCMSAAGSRGKGACPAAAAGPVPTSPPIPVHITPWLLLQTDWDPPRLHLAVEAASAPDQAGPVSPGDTAGAGSSPAPLALAASST